MDTELNEVVFSAVWTYAEVRIVRFVFVIFLCIYFLVYNCFLVDIDDDVDIFAAGAITVVFSQLVAHGSGTRTSLW